MKTLKKIFIYTVGILVVLFAGLLLSAYLFKDSIIDQFVKEANKSLNTPVAIGKIEVSAWTDFPNLAIVFTNVYVEDSHPGKDTLLWARSVSFHLNPIEVWRGNYDVRGLRIEDSKTRLRINVAGKSNYNIIKPTGDSTATISFELKNVSLINTEVSYDDFSAEQHDLFSSDDITASIHIVGDLYQITGSGDILSHRVGVGGQLFLVDKKFLAKAEVDYDDDNKVVTIKPSTLELEQSYFELTGVYSFKEKNEMDIQAHGKDTDIQTVMALLPEEFGNRFSEYESDGDVYFTANVKGELSETKNPLFSMTFGCTNATLYQPKYDSRITKANLEGSFATPSFTDLTRSEIFLKKITGELNGEKFSADFSLQNFDDPFVSLQFNGELDAASILQFYPLEDVKELSGRIRADLSFVGEVGLLKSKATAQKVKMEGTLDLQGINISLGKKRVRISDLNGALQFNNNDLALSDTRGSIGKSDFILNGLFKNSVTFLLFDNQPIGIEADLKSQHLDIDELFQMIFGDRQTDDYEFSISHNLHLNFNCDVKSLQYQRFKPRQVRGNLLIKNQMAVSRNLSFKAMGGGLHFDGIVDAKNPKAIDVVSSFKLEGVHIDSLFYVFENFDQDFIQDKHLKGQADADITMEMVLNEKLNLFHESLIADISTTIRKGELNDFEPLKALDRYLDDEGLSRLRFADLRNDIHIENKIIMIPQMEVRSNVTTIQLSGTHTIDQHIDYRIVAPLRNKKKIDPDEAFGAIEQNSSGQAKVFLKIMGTTDDYDVSYDKRALKEKLAGDLKKEAKELKDAFRLKGAKKKKELELSDEVFDWRD